MLSYHAHAKDTIRKTYLWGILLTDEKLILQSTSTIPNKFRNERKKHDYVWNNLLALARMTSDFVRYTMHVMISSTKSVHYVRKFYSQKGNNRKAAYFVGERKRGEFLCVLSILPVRVFVNFSFFFLFCFFTRNGIIK